MASNISSTMASAAFSLSRRRPGSPWMPMPTSISSSAISNSWAPFSGGTHEVRATPMLRTWLLTLSAILSSSSRLAPRSAAAPQAFITKKLPATPLRPIE